MHGKSPKLTKHQTPVTYANSWRNSEDWTHYPKRWIHCWIIIIMLLLPWNRIFSQSKWLHKTLESLDFISKKPLRNNISERGYYTNPLRVARYNISVPHRTLAPPRDPGHPNSDWHVQLMGCSPSRLTIATKKYTSCGLVYISWENNSHYTHIMLFFFEQPNHFGKIPSIVNPTFFVGDTAANQDPPPNAWVGSSNPSIWWIQNLFGNLSWN